MTTATSPVTSSFTEESKHSGRLLRDSWIIAKRGMLHLMRQPEQLTDATVQAVMFVLLFAYVFGGAIAVPGGGSYREFLIAGIFAQTVGFSAFNVAITIANDKKAQVVERFRSLPMNRNALLAGYAISNLLKVLIPITLMSICGLIVGWRIHTSLMDAVLGYLLLMAFAFALIWVGILLGCFAKTPEGVMGIAFVIIFPITFIASTFAPTSTMPTVIQTIAEWNPVTTVANALRIQFGNPNTPVQPNDPWSLQHPYAYSLIAIAIICAICAPLAVSMYKRSVKS